MTCCIPCTYTIGELSTFLALATHAFGLSVKYYSGPSDDHSLISIIISYACRSSSHHVEFYAYSLGEQASRRWNLLTVIQEVKEGCGCARYLVCVYAFVTLGLIQAAAIIS